MFAPDWDKPCKSCSFWADSYNGVAEHVAHRDTTMVAASRAPYVKLATTAARLGWTFPWYACEDAFAQDYGVAFSPAQLEIGELEYNYRKRKFRATDMPGFSAYVREGDAVYHTYSTYERGLDAMNVAYQMLDLTALGRHEDAENPMNWVRRHDEYAP